MAVSNAGAERQAVVLVVEDDENIRPVIVEWLEIEGYTAVAAATASEALAILNDTSRPIDLLLTDIAMPDRLNGFGLAHRAKQLRPDLPVIYASGYYKDAPWRELGIGYGPLLEKPFKATELLAAIREVLSPL